MKTNLEFVLVTLQYLKQGLSKEHLGNRYEDFKIFFDYNVLTSGDLFESPGFIEYYGALGSKLDFVAGYIAGPYSYLLGNAHLNEISGITCLPLLIYALSPFVINPNLVSNAISGGENLFAFFPLALLGAYNFGLRPLHNQIAWIIKERQAKIDLNTLELKKWDIEWGRLAIEDRYLNPRSIDGVYLDNSTSLLADISHSAFKLFTDNPDLVERMLSAASLFS